MLRAIPKPRRWLSPPSQQPTTYSKLNISRPSLNMQARPSSSVTCRPARCPRQNRRPNRIVCSRVFQQTWFSCSSSPSSLIFSGRPESRRMRAAMAQLRRRRQATNLRTELKLSRKSLVEGRASKKGRRRRRSESARLRTLREKRISAVISSRSESIAQQIKGFR